MATKNQIGPGHARALLLAALLFLLAPIPLFAGANMRRDGALTLIQTNADNHGFYAAAVDPTNGFAYFASRFVYKVDITGALPVQIGTNAPRLNGQAVDGVMDPSAGCAYFAAGSYIYQIAANGTNAATLASQLASPFGNIWQLELDPTDPNNHYLYFLCGSSDPMRLYKLNLNNFPNGTLSYAAADPSDPPLYHGTIDLTNQCAYFGTAIYGTNPPALVKFALGSGAAAPSRVGSCVLDSTLRDLGPTVLDLAHGYGYSLSDDNDLSFGQARLYMFALNGAATPSLVTHVDLHPGEGYCHVGLLKADRGLLYFGCDLTYPGKVYRFKLGTGTNPPVETGALLCLTNTNHIASPGFGVNPGFATNWGEVFLHSLAYDSVRDFAYFGRDYADGQIAPYTDQIVKVALDRDETLIRLTTDSANTDNSIPYGESFSAYTNGFGLANANGWFAEDNSMGVVVSNNFASGFAGVFPIPGGQPSALLVDGAVTNCFGPSAYSNVLVDFMLQANFWTDPILPGADVVTNSPFAVCITTNGHLAVWNCTNPPTAGNGWTELMDTSVTNGQFVRLTIAASYNPDANGFFYYRVFLNGAPSLNPAKWYATADLTPRYFGAFVAQGHFTLGDLVVASPVVNITNLTFLAGSGASLRCVGIPGFTHHVWAATDLGQANPWILVSTNLSDANGAWTYTDTNAVALPSRFYRAGFP